MNGLELSEQEVGLNVIPVSLGPNPLWKRLECRACGMVPPGYPSFIRLVPGRLTSKPPSVRSRLSIGSEHDTGALPGARL